MRWWSSSPRGDRRLDGDQLGERVAVASWWPRRSSSQPPPSIRRLGGGRRARRGGQAVVADRGHGVSVRPTMGRITRPRLSATPTRGRRVRLRGCVAAAAGDGACSGVCGGPRWVAEGEPAHGDGMPSSGGLCGIVPDKLDLGWRTCRGEGGGLGGQPQGREQAAREAFVESENQLTPLMSKCCHWPDSASSWMSLSTPRYTTRAVPSGSM